MKINNSIPELRNIYNNDINYFRNSSPKRLLFVFNDLLNEIYYEYESSKQPGSVKDFRKIAYKVLINTLSDMELSYIIKLEVDLKDRFPGVQKRFRELLNKRIIDETTE